MRTAAVLALLAICHASPGETIIHSGVTQSNLIELYTSEGCSSCPPADHWLTTLKEHPELWDQLVPIAFHVDYWDYIGWKDRFARSEFTERQRQYSREGSVPTVYTPALISNGREWRNFSWKRPVEVPNQKVGSLTVEKSQDHLDIKFQPEWKLPDDRLSIHVALLGFGLKTEVRAGENIGRELNHDFVVLEYMRASLHPADGAYQGTTRQPQSNIDAEEYALAVWVSKETEQAPLQAAGAWLN